MKNFIICMETAFIALCMGMAIGAEREREKIQEENEASKEETPA